MKHSLFLAAVEVTAKTVRTLLTTPQLTRPFRQPFTPVMRGAEWLIAREERDEVLEPWSDKLLAAACDCGANLGCEHYITCPAYEAPLTQAEIRQIRSSWWVERAVEAKAAKTDGIFRSGGQTYETGPRPTLSTSHAALCACGHWLHPGGMCSCGCTNVRIKTSDATSATSSSGEDPPRGAEEAPRGADSQIVELTADAEKRVAAWVRAVISYGRSDAELVRGFQRLIAVSDKAEQ